MSKRKSGRKKAHKHKLFALVNVQMALGQTAGCPRVNRAKKFMCSPRNTGNINFSLWLTGGLSQGCPDFQKVYVFKVYVPSRETFLTNFEGHWSLQIIIENKAPRHWSILISPEIHMDQWHPNLSESSGLHRHLSTECSSL